MDGEMGVVMGVSGVGEMPVVEGARWTVSGRDGKPAVFVFVREPDEHLAGCVRRVVVVAQALAENGAAVGLAVGPVAQERGGDERLGNEVPGYGAGPTAERAGRALLWARPGDVVLAWGSQAYLAGEFASVATGFVRLVTLV